jgi:hypothetical protein
MVLRHIAASRRSSAPPTLGEVGFSQIDLPQIAQSVSLARSSIAGRRRSRNLNMLALAYRLPPIIRGPFHDRRWELEPCGGNASGRPASYPFANDRRYYTQGQPDGRRKWDRNSRWCCKWQRDILEGLYHRPNADDALEFNGTIDGDEVSGSVVLGDFGTSSFSGTRR